MNIPSIHAVTNWHNKTVIVRAGLNVPIESDGTVGDDFRIQRLLPTLSYLQEQEAKIVVISHLGRQATDSLAPVARYLEQQIDHVIFKPDFFAPDIESHVTTLKSEIDAAVTGQIWLLDNLRQTDREQSNDPDLARQLATLADVYVNEAFSVSHRSHMSLDALPNLITPSVAGYACSEEVEQLSLAVNPPGGSIAIISGNKFATKLPLIQKFLKRYDTVVVGGALANTLYQLQGYNVGQSLVEDDLDEHTTRNLQKIVAHKKLYLPAIVVCGQGGGEKTIKHISEVDDHDYIYDIAPEGLIELEPLISRCPLVVWNGPLGYYEGGYIEGTQRLLELIAQSDAQSIVGGGNTVDAARDLGFQDQISFLSTGGGAMIDFLTHGTLPGFKHLHT